MTRNIFLLLAALLLGSAAMAIPAHPGKTVVTQPDGSTVTIRLHGDEYLHFNTTADGYSIVRRADGGYVYAELGADGQLAPTAIMAHDADRRTAEELAWLSGRQKYLAPQLTPSAAQQKQAETSRRAKAAAGSPARLYDYNNFRGLVILVQYNDREFSRPDYADIINDMVNKAGYTGYGTSGVERYTGSVRDYFHDNSCGLFSPEFDVVGPVTIDYSQYDANGTANAAPLVIAALQAANPLVDFSQYDGDGDGTVDMIYFIFAGIGSNIGSNNPGLIWPHASSVYNPEEWWRPVTFDGVNMGRYACSTELYGTTNWSIIDGIGVICHEFSHVLGLEDLYDTDYEGSGGESPHPGEWCIMASGGYLNNGRTPIGYSLYERYAVGFAQPQLITGEGNFSLQPIGDSGMGYKLNSTVNKEFFLLENRQQSSKWDTYGAGHGLLVFRVDSTNTGKWQRDEVNTNPNHMYFEMVRAGGATSSAAKASDPFPGTKRVTRLNNTTEPASLKSWAGKPTLLGLDNISEAGGVITFDVVDVNVLKSISLPQELTLGLGLSAKIEETRVPDYAPYTLQWSTANAAVATVDQNGMVKANGVGQTTITVVANGDAALTATCLVTVEPLEPLSDIAAFASQEQGYTGAFALDGALVTFAIGDNVFLRDSSGAIWLKETGLELGTGDKLDGLLFGTLAIADSVPQLLPVEYSTNSEGYTLTSGNAVTPHEMKLADLNADHFADLVTIKATALERQSGVWAVSGDRRVRLYNSMQVPDIKVPTVSSSKRYDVTGIYLTNRLNGKVIEEIQLTDVIVESTELSGIQSLRVDAGTALQVYTLDGRLVGTTTYDSLRRLQLPRGVYVAKGAGVCFRFAR